MGGVTQKKILYLTFLFIFCIKFVSGGGIEYQPDAHTAGLWHLDEGSGEITVDASPNDNDGSLHGGGRFINALNFDGTNDFVNVSHDDALSLINTSFTLEAWIKWDGSNNPSNIITKRIADKGYQLLIETDDLLHFRVSGEPTFGFLQSTSQIPTGVLTHVAITFDQLAGEIYLYLDGSLDNSTTATEILTSPNNTGSVNIARKTVPSGTLNSFDGVIDEIRMSNVARTPNNFCINTPCSSDANTIALWHFDEGSGAIANDSSSSGYDGIISGATWLVSPLWTSDVAPISGSSYSLEFDGNNNFVEITDSQSLDITQALTLEAWIKPASTSSGKIICKDHTQNTYCLSYGDPGAQKLRFSINDSNGQTVTVDSLSTIPINAWTHVAGTFTPNDALKLFINGSVDNSQTTTATGIHQTDTPVQIGSSVGGTTFDGNIDEVRISNTARDPCEFNLNVTGCNTTPKLKILAVPLLWTNTQQAFNDNIGEQINFFVNDTNLINCQERVVVDTLNVNSQNLDTFTCDVNNCGVEQIVPFVESLGINPGDYDHILGFVENTPCQPFAGCSDGSKTSWIETSREMSVAAHEIGHFYGLEDQYCSNPSGSDDCRCNDAGEFLLGCFIEQGFRNDVNPLDVELGCNATLGGSCCGPSAELPSCNTINYNEGPCCLGNVNLKNGRSTMSYADVQSNPNGQGPRGFDMNSLTHLNIFSQLSCVGKGTPQDILDINLIIYPNDTVEENWIFLTNGEGTTYNKSGNYSLIIYDNQTSPVINQSLDIVFGYNGPVYNGTSYMNNSFITTPLYFQVPYNTSMHQLNLSHGNDLIYSKMLNFCDNDLLCEVTENYESCPLDCPLNQTDNLCLPFDDSICDPDCAFGVDVNCALDVVNVINLSQEGMQVIFEAEVVNFANQTFENITWSFDTGELVENSSMNITLTTQERFFLFFQHNYSLVGSYDVTAFVQSGFLSDNESINITIS